MDPDNDSPGERHRSPRAFADALADLKQNGAAIFVVGEVPETVGRTVRTRLFGENTMPPRHRIAISTVNRSSPPIPGTDMTDPHQWMHLSYVTAQHRSAASATPPDASAHHLSDRTCDSLAELVTAVGDTIADFEEHSAGLSPSQLRLGFDSIEPLVETNEKALFRALHLLLARVKSVQGMGHVPLLRPIDSRVIQTFSPLFDALIELRVIDGLPHQRWVFPATGLTSDWLAL